MIDMTNALNMEHSLTTIHPIIKRVESYTKIDAIKVNVYLSKWAWLGLGFIHQHIKDKVEIALTIYGLRNAIYEVETH